MNQNTTQDETEDEPIAYHKPDQETSPLWCQECEPSRDEGLFGGIVTEPLYADDLENFEEVSCVSCATPLLANGEPTGNSPDVHNVDEYDGADYCPNADEGEWEYCPYCGDEIGE